MRVVKYVFVTLLFLEVFLLGASAAQQDPPPIDYATAHLSRVVRAVRTESPISLDGRLDEPAWRLAEPATDFIQGSRSSPRPGYPASERTEVRFVYDNENLFVGFICFEDDIAKIVTSSLTRDFAPNLGDEIGLTLSSQNDNRSGFFFSTNPAGARRDLQLSNDGQVNQDWHGVWDVRIGIEADRWIVEMVIPFKTLRFSDDESQQWRLNMGRTLRGHSIEQSMWSPLPIRYHLGRVSMAGTLTGLEGIKQGRNLNLKPFAVTSAIQTRNDGKLHTDGDLDGGVDFKYGLTSQITLDATYRTDFSQAEIDQNQVNLTRFNLFFPEKREFFLENSGIFNFGDRATGGNLLPFFSRRIGLSESGIPVPIVGGTRVSGTAGKQEVGFLAMKTERTREAPSNNFVVGRLKRNLLGNSFVGAIFTSRDSSRPGDSNRVYGLDTVLQFFNRLDVGGYYLRSDTPGLRKDNDAGRFLVKWQDDVLTVSAEYEKVGPNFKPEMGFVRGGDTSHYSGNFAYNPRIRRRGIRDITLRSNYNYFASVTGRIETRSSEAGFAMAFNDNSVIDLNANESFERLERLFIRYRVPQGDYTFRTYSASYTSDKSRRISGRMSATWGGFWNGTARTLGGEITVKPTHHWQSDLTYSRNAIALPSGSFPSTLVGFKLLYAFNSRAFLNSFVQYNAETHQVTTNIRFNIMYRPLSDVFVVFNERRDTRGNGIVDRGLILKVTRLFQF